MTAPLLRRCFRSLGVSLAGLLLAIAGLLSCQAPALAITAPELRSQRSQQDLQPDMHGRKRGFIVLQFFQHFLNHFRIKRRSRLIKQHHAWVHAQ